VNLPRTTADMSTRGESVEPDEVAPGDLIFFNTTGRPHSHVGIYVGKLRFVNAPSTGGTVRLDYLTNPYWAKRFDGIRRVAPPKSAPTPFDAPVYLASPAAAPAAPAAPAAASARAQPGVAEPVETRAAAQRQERVAVTAALARAQPQAAAIAQDQFEPPPSALTAAQRQAQAAGAVSPAVAAASDAPDPIAAVADAFEPPPPTARLAAQQARSVQQPAAAEPPVRVMRASTGSLAAPRPAASDDPIARFANGGD
jgi:hypothetical protein